MENKKKINNIFYGVIGVLTLMVAIVGATFAYFTATATNNVIKGNMATIGFNLSVTKVTNVDNTIGVIPMSNNMVEAALTSTNGVCVDDNNNPVCQVYKITVNNTSSASMFLDGYVSLTGGSGNPTDVTAMSYTYTNTATTMRWAQAFCTTETDGVVSGCTTAGSSTARTTTAVTWTNKIGTASTGSGHNTGDIKTTLDNNITVDTDINGNTYKVIKTNYIRISDRSSTATTHNRATDITSALVFSQYLNANDNSAANNTGTSTGTTYTDSQVYYIVVWLSETGTNQTAGATGATAPGAASNATNFYQGKVTFITAQGGEVTAAFSGNVRVGADTTTGTPKDYS